jgi:hypothetical protein
MVWWDEAFSNELGTFLEVVILLNILSMWMYPEPESISYELFMWGDVGMLTDVRFYGVAPHWYFRPFMAWLIVCPHHKTGIFGLLYFFFVLFHQPTLHGVRRRPKKKWFKMFRFDVTQKLLKYIPFRNIFKRSATTFMNAELNIMYQFTYTLFFMCALYTSSFLPYGRFYNRLGGNEGMLFSYLYICLYLTFSSFRKPFSLTKYNRTILKNSKSLNNY